ncbi:DegT/DnrJ/EryC1/StrS family aminotransferase [Fundidesulfovibrio terrae]|uniref:DegT/DnrJ/EryC1/StrS family aminotransferase n=1 Tax=Fundidesulfovibrio terrae TaxID=2922866 RepID=UPI001FAFF1FD|nr:DegT/DnrJ/EryC1/StrS family aminotransferase [Fundidesulfovibrio terrae]
MTIPFVDLKAQYESIKQEIADAVTEVLETRTFILGPHVAAFEKCFAKSCGAEHCIGVGNGTDALFIALKSLGFGPGDEALVPANTFVATSEAVSMCGGRPVFVDAEEAGYHMDLADARAKVTARTKVVLPVHLYGQPMDMDAVRGFAGEFGLKIVQDCAQAHAATFGGKPLAEFGDACCYSFFPGKNLGAYGDAGAIVTNDEELAGRCRMFANHGRRGKYDHEFEGVNSRMDGLHGAVLGVKLKYLDQWTQARRTNAGAYDELLAGIPGVVRPVALPGRRHVYHLYVVRVRNRDGLRAFLSEHGVATGVHYPIALPSLTAYSHLGAAPQDFPVAGRLAGEILSLPMYPELSREQIEYVANLIRSFAGNA